jgi:hypothetical protein
MKRSLAMTVLALGLIAAGCDDTGDTTPDTGATGGRGGSGGTGGSGGAGGTGGSGGTGGTGATGGTGGRAPDARPRDMGAADRRPADMRLPDSGAADRAADTTPDTAGTSGTRMDTGGAYFNVCDSYKGGGSLGGVPAGDFCGQFMATCSFGGKNRFESMSSCVRGYNASASKGRQAAHLCDAKAGLGMANCDRAAGFGLGRK